MKPRLYARHVDYAEVLKKWESGRFESKAMLARHFGVERGGMARILRIARQERGRTWTVVAVTTSHHGEGL